MDQRLFTVKRGVLLPCSVELKINSARGQTRQKLILQTVASKVLSLRSHGDLRFFALERIVYCREE